MTLKKELNQERPFKSEYHRTTVNLIFTYNWLTLQLKNFLKTYDCTFQQYNVLRILKGANEAISTREIRNRMVEKMADTSRLVERLFVKGWVNRVVSSEDRRLVDVTISKEGLKFLEHSSHIDDLVQDIFHKLNKEELDQLNAILNKLRS